LKKYKQGKLTHHNFSSTNKRKKQMLKSLFQSVKIHILKKSSLQGALLAQPTKTFCLEGQIKPKKACQLNEPSFNGPANLQKEATKIKNIHKKELER